MWVGCARWGARGGVPVVGCVRDGFLAPAAPTGPILTRGSAPRTRGEFGWGCVGGAGGWGLLALARR